jgi:hypothetical protein
VCIGEVKKYKNTPITEVVSLEGIAKKYENENIAIIKKIWYI